MLLEKNKTFKLFNFQFFTRRYKIASFQYELLKTNESKDEVIRKSQKRFAFFKIDKCIYVCTEDNTNLLSKLPYYLVIKR